MVKLHEQGYVILSEEYHIPRDSGRDNMQRVSVPCTAYSVRFHPGGIKKEIRLLILSGG